MNDHIDQLKEWWETAEVPTTTSLPRNGDRIIFRYNSEWYEIATADGDAKESDLYEGMRILTRARKPAWHDAVAIIATGDAGDGDLFTGVWVPEGPHGNWISADTGIILSTDQLYNVTPLIEAKVTDEMIDRILDVLHAWNDTYPSGLGTKLAAAALGIES